MGRGFMICGFIVNATGRGFEKKPLGLDLVMIGYGLDRGGPKDSENAHNSFLTKCTEKGF